MMKHFSLTSILFIVFFYTAFAQIDTSVWYPLKTGNYWEYKIHLPDLTTITRTKRVIGDSIHTNGKSYKIIKYTRDDGYIYTEYWLQRVEGEKVYAPCGLQNEELKLFDFEVPESTIWLTCGYYRGYRGHNLNVPIQITGMTHEYKCFHSVVVTATDTIWDPIGSISNTVGIAKGLGEPELWIDGEGISYLTGAIINGKKYGVVTEIKTETNEIKKLEVSLYPNPCNNTAKIYYSIKEPGQVNILIYNSIGEKVHTLLNEYKAAGNYYLQLNLEAVPSGIYLIRIKQGNNSSTKKISLLK